MKAGEAKTEYRTSAQVAKVFGVSAKRVQQLTADGVIETEETPKGRRYPWEKTVQKYIAFLSDKANGREKKETDASLETERLRAEVRIKEAKAEAAELELAELRGIMHQAQDVEAIVTDSALLIRSMLMALPGRMAVDLANAKTAPEASELVKKEVYGILNAMAQYQYDPEAYKKRVRERRGWNEQQREEENQ